MAKIRTRMERHTKKHGRVRQRVRGTAERPRLCVFRSLQHIYAQVIDDVSGSTLVAASTRDKEFRDSGSKTKNKDAAAQVGKTLARRALDSGLKNVVFDRGGYLYHGRVKHLADGAREGGLLF